MESLNLMQPTLAKSAVFGLNPRFFSENCSFWSKTTVLDLNPHFCLSPSTELHQNA